MCSWSAGTFSRTSGPNGWQNDAAASIGIQAGLHDNAENELTTGINECLNKSGQNSPTADISMGGFKWTTVGNAAARNQYMSLGQVQDGSARYGGQSTGTGTAQAITLTPAITAYVEGQVFYFVALTANTGSLTLAVNGLAATTILDAKTGVALLGGEIATFMRCEVIYVGTNFVLLNGLPAKGVWTPTFTGFSADPATPVVRYIKSGTVCTVSVRCINAGTSNATGFTISAPFTAANITNMTWNVKAGEGVDNSVYTSDIGVYISASSAAFTITRNGSATGWTNAGGKGANFQITYETI